jgi:hypothetical protein
MASSFSNVGIELIATGEQSGTWGSTTNTNLQIIDRLTNGVGAISLTGTTHTLTTTNSGSATLSDGQYAVLVFGGTPSGTNTVTISPNTVQHVYIVKNNSGQSVVLTQGSGGNVTVADGKSAIVYADGAGAGAAVVDVTATFNFQAASASLTAIAALATTDGNFIVGDGSTWVAESGSTVRTSLGLGSIATQAANNVSITGGSISGITDLAVSDGGTGASSFTANNVLLGNGTSAFQVVAPGTTGNVLTSNGTTWVSQAAGAALTGQTDSASPFETSLGSGAGVSVTGANCTFVGYEAGNRNTTGSSNTGFGYRAIRGFAFDFLTGSNNTGVGNQVGTSLTTGAGNTLVGHNSGLSISTGASNTFIGITAGQSVSTGSNNVAIGVDTLREATTGGRNIAIGQAAMRLGVATATTGDNIAIGYQAGFDITSATNNFLGGRLAGENITTGSNNVAIGNGALDAATTGGRNIAIGQDAMGSGVATATSGDNIAIGYQAGNAITSGTNNTAIGNTAGSTLTTGANNTLLGNGAAASSATVSNEITLGNSSITNLRVPGVGFQFDTTDGLIVPKTITAGGTTGAQTINKTAGSVNFAAAATSLVVTNSFVDANSVIIATVGTNDATMTSVQAVAGAGSFTLYANAAATAETRVNWFVAN